MSAAQGFAVHDGLLHPHLRHCSSTAPAVRQLSSAVYTTDHHAVCVAGPAAAAACNLLTIRPSVWLAQQQQQQPATYQTTSEMRQVLSTVFVWIFFFSFTSIQSTLEALQ